MTVPQPGGEIWQLRGGRESFSMGDRVSRDGRGRTRGWLREERRGDEGDEGSGKRCGEKAQKGGKQKGGKKG